MARFCWRSLDGGFARAVLESRYFVPEGRLLEWWRTLYRFSGSLPWKSSYVFSKILTNADSFSGSNGSLDTANRRLERSVGSFDQTHTVKPNTVYEVPFGKGKRWLTQGFASRVIGGWRFSGIQSYNTGFPIGVTANGSLPIFNGANRPNVTTYDWLGPNTGSSFDPNKGQLSQSGRFPRSTRGRSRQLSTQECGGPRIL